MPRLLKNTSGGAGPSGVPIRLIASLCLLAAAVEVQGAPAPDFTLPAATRSSHPFHDVLKPGLGFSFTYDGKRVGPGLPDGWQRSSRKDRQELTLRHQTGLVVTRTARLWSDAEAVEYTLTFKNESRQVLPPISAVNAMDLSFGPEVLSGLSMISSGGGDAGSVYPPKDFALNRVDFGPMTPLDGQVILNSVDGYPSRTTLPFFFLDNPSKSSGVFVAVGWSGQWRSIVNASFANGNLRLQSIAGEANLRLNPGEQLAGPMMLAGFFRGAFADGANMLRRLVRDHYLPPQRATAPLLYTTWFDIGTEMDEGLFKTLADRAAEIGMEIFLLDAGWYKGALSHPYSQMGETWAALSRPLGNWELGPELSRFPNGLSPLADYVRSKGMQFGLWFEPERSGQASLLAEKHPEWTIALDRRPWRVVDFGKPEVQEYFCGIIDRYIRELGVRYIRWDANLEMLLYWQSRDPADRKGITEIRHQEGLHRVEEWIRKNHPDVMLEACASGGNRIDLATMQQRHTYWISDQTMDPLIVRFHLEGMNHFMPGERQLVAFSPPKSTYQKPGFTFPDMAFQSYFGGSFGASGRLHEWPEPLKAQMRKHVAVYKQLRRFLKEDYYLLEPQARNLQSWSAWQFHDPKSDEGFVQAFRVRAPDTSRRVVMKGLDPKLKYRFTDPYTNQSFETQGASLSSKGLEFTLAPMSSSVLLYRSAR